VLSCVLVCTMSSTTYAPSNFGDYKIHCLYLYKFSQLIQWPSSSPNNEFTIGIAGISPIIPALEQYIASKNKSSTIKYKLLRFPSAQAITNCNILYVTKELLGNFDAIQKSIAGKETLLVTEVPGLIRKGSCINLIYDEGSSIKIQVNKTAIESHKLKASSELLKLATEIM
jgi:YfiR/HmsC-like